MAGDTTLTRTRAPANDQETALKLRYLAVTNKIRAMPEAYRTARNIEASLGHGYSKMSYEVFDLVLRADMHVCSQPTQRHLQQLEALYDCHERLRALEL